MPNANRNERLFREGMRSLTREIDSIFSRNAAAGRLQSGATIKALVQAMDATTVEAIENGLRGITAKTEHAGKERRRLLAGIGEALRQHHEAATGVLRVAVQRIGRASDFDHALPLIEQAKRRHFEQLADFEEGWTAPIEKHWGERHPLYFAILLAIIGAIFGAAATAFFT